MSFLVFHTKPGMNMGTCQSISLQPGLDDRYLPACASAARKIPVLYLQPRKRYLFIPPPKALLRIPQYIQGAFLCGMFPCPAAAGRIQPFPIHKPAALKPGERRNFCFAAVACAGYFHSGDGRTDAAVRHGQRMPHIGICNQGRTIMTVPSRSPTGSISRAPYFVSRSSTAFATPRYFMSSHPVSRITPPLPMRGKKNSSPDRVGL